MARLYPTCDGSPDCIVREAAAPSGCRVQYELYLDDALEWLDRAAAESIHSVVTDPPYGVLEYTPSQLEKMKNGRGGVWRIPPAYDGCQRRPLPRFTVLNDHDRQEIRSLFQRLAERLMRVLVPGAHVLIATNPLVSYLVYEPFIAAGFEKRGEIIREVMTLRGGDRPKNAHEEFPEVTVIPRSCWEPWGLFRKPCDGRVQDNLRKWKTGGLRRISPSEPFKDIVRSAPARGLERQIAPHPSLKPQHFLRQIVRASLPLGEGIVLDPFMGCGSTIAAAIACGYRSTGVELNPEYYLMALDCIPKLAALQDSDWKYEGSGAGAGGGGRTHTFSIRNPATRLKGKAVYARSDISVSGSKAVPRNGV